MTFPGHDRSATGHSKIWICENRYPVILKPPAYESWLDPENQDAAELEKILKNEIITELVSYPVSKQVNSTRNNDSSCIEALKSAAE